uniref:Uncharacterized protein n=1 Tax=Vespula pensylvanica TaxID=30213 RepID=A0A834U9G2_VESPE|nr:hypothetical protein H0235_008814 [Vespula pensylvanica]
MPLTKAGRMVFASYGEPNIESRCTCYENDVDYDYDYDYNIVVDDDDDDDDDEDDNDDDSEDNTNRASGCSAFCSMTRTHRSVLSYNNVTSNASCTFDKSSEILHHKKIGDPN